MPHALGAKFRTLVAHAAAACRWRATGSRGVRAGGAAAASRRARLCEARAASAQHVSPPWPRPTFPRGGLAAARLWSRTLAAASLRRGESLLRYSDVIPYMHTSHAPPPEPNGARNPRIVWRN